MKKQTPILHHAYEIYATGIAGFVSIDACVPATLAIKIFKLIRRHLA